ncbi:MAG: hypothetical protein D8M58_11275 [Calditrichaeota bacterium]|nr:MAG: hypothetical protein DWQ03_10650 [Calditrichota bacterium]MBL1205974.1 hypothetical protein [Calditrichota bacterium]NOG45802.1 hypothetical protein [Calditrichota bacterium]
MKVATILFLFCLIIIPGIMFAEDGMKAKFHDVQMNINDDNYIVFEDETLIICDRQSDKYLIEITPEIDLYIESNKVSLNSNQRSLLRDYYEAQQILFSKRNSIGAKSIHIGLEGVKLAATAVGGVVELALSGFDEEVEDEFEKEMEKKSEKIERQADRLEDDAEEFEYQVKQINRLNRKINREIDDLYYFDLSVDEDRVCVRVDTD